MFQGVVVTCLPVINSPMCQVPANCSLHVMALRISNLRLTALCPNAVIYVLFCRSPVHDRIFLKLVMTCDWSPHQTPKSELQKIIPHINKKYTN